MWFSPWKVTWVRVKWLILILVLTLLEEMKVAIASTFSFCSRDKLYSFTTEACPGGILFKEPLNIDEKCHCFGSDLRIYSTCRESSLVKKQGTPGGCAQPLIDPEEPWNGQVRLLIPVHFTRIPRRKKEGCKEIRETCVRSNRTMVLTKPESIAKKFGTNDDKLMDPIVAKILDSVKGESPGGNSSFSSSSSSEEEEGEVGASSSSSSSSHEILKSALDYDGNSLEPLQQTSSPSTSQTTKSFGRNVPEQKAEGRRKSENQYESSSNTILPPQDALDSLSPTNWRHIRNEGQPDMEERMMVNKKLMRFIADVKAGHIPDPPPNTKVFRMLKEAMRIVSKVVPNKLIKDVNFYEAYLAFRQLFSTIDEDERTDRLLDLDDYNSIMLALELCLSNARELSFKTTGNPRQIQKFYHLLDVGYKEEDPQMPGDRSHNIDGEDYIVGIMWKVLDITLPVCINELRQTHEAQFDFVNAIENVFQREEVQKRWYQPQLADSEGKSKLELISHPNMKIFMDNLDKVDAAAHLMSPYKHFLRKPKGVLMHPLPSENAGDTDSLSPPETDSVPEPARRKRSSRSNVVKDAEEVLSMLSLSPALDLQDATIFEIFDGTAYCLQKYDQDLAPGYLNAVPSIKKFCGVLPKSKGHKHG